MERPPEERSQRASAPSSGRASDRRREQGRAPEPQGPKDTRTSLREPEPKAERAQRGREPAFASLACVKGPEQGATLALVDGSFTIGRARENQLVLKDIAASRRHVRIDVERGRARLVDLGSGNGTKVNGRRVSEHALAHGDTIEIGACLIQFQESGKAPPPPDLGRDEAQARVVAAADELAKELSAKLRFGEEGFEDGFVAKTRALKTADARAIAEEIQREAQQAAKGQAQPSTRKLNDRLWNETFTNMPLSEVVATDQALQGGAAQQRAEAAAPTDQFRPPKRQPPPVPAPSPMSMPPPPRFDDASQSVEFSGSTSGRSSLITVLLSAITVIVVGVIAFAGYVFFIKDGQLGAPKVDPNVALINAERDAEYATAIARAQDAYAKEDWKGVRDYTTAALQVKPDDPMAKQYRRDADRRIADAEAKAKAAQTPPPTTEPPKPVEPTPPAAETKPVAPPPAVTKPVDPPPPVVEKPAPVEKPKPVAVEKPKPKPKPKPAAKKSMSEADAKAQFNAAIDAFRSKDNETACQLLDKVADRAPADSTWKGKAESLFLKKCGG